MFVIRYPTLVSRLIIYYTVYHNVDEDVLTIQLHGGNWSHENMVGVMYRQMVDPPAGAGPHVALKNKCKIHYPRNCR